MRIDENLTGEAKQHPAETDPLHWLRKKEARRARSSLPKLAAVVSAAVLALASVKVAQAADTSPRPQEEASRSTRSLAADGSPATTDRTKSTAAELQYYSVPGTAFQPLVSATTYQNALHGCMHATSGSSLTFHAPVSLPNGATIKSVRFYFYDASIQEMSLYLDRYTPGQSSTILASLSSAGTAGTGLTDSGDLNAVVDHASYTYALFWIPTFALSAQQICGARIAYYPPVASAALCSLDADGNGAIDAVTDGILILRAMFGLTGTAVTNSAIGSGTPSRTTWALLRGFFNGSCGANFAQ